MMWKNQAIEFWQTIAGGAKSHDEATAMWEDMSANYKESKLGNE